MTEVFETLLEKAQDGDNLAREAVYGIAFHRLRKIASKLLCRERLGHTLQPTALVNEVFLKLHRLEMQILNEDHFFRISARAMRQVLIDHARTKKPVTIITPEEISRLLAEDGGVENTETHLTVKIAFDKLRSLDATVASTVWARCVEGVTISEMSAIQNRPEWRVRADYDFGLRWLASGLKNVR
jgi:RNA polymerase sigma-70 factor, ECF subfamily